MRRTALRFILAALLAVHGALARAAADGGVDIEVVEASLAEKGPQATLATYFSCDQRGGSAYRAVAGGSRAWVALAEKLIAHADACYTEGLQAALGEAMRKAPGQVLPLVDRTPALGADHICLPFISDEQPRAAQLGELRRSRRAIAAVQDRRLSGPKAACLRLIRSVERSLAPAGRGRGAAPRG